MIIYILVFCLGILAAFFAGAYVRKPFDVGLHGKKRECVEQDFAAEREQKSEDSVKEKQWNALLDYTVERKDGGTL